MNLRRIKARSKSFEHFLGTVELSKPLAPEILLSQLQLLRKGSPEAAKAIIESHVRLAMQIAGRYYMTLWDESHLDDIVAVALLKLTESVNRVKEKGLEHDNITAYIVTCIHGAISNYIYDKIPTVPVPHSTAHLTGEQAKPCGNKYGTITDLREQFKILELEDLIDVCAVGPLEKVIVKLRKANLTDEEVARACKISKAHAWQIRKRIEDRYNDYH